MNSFTQSLATSIKNSFIEAISPFAQAIADAHPGVSVEEILKIWNDLNPDMVSFTPAPQEYRSPRKSSASRAPQEYYAPSKPSVSKAPAGGYTRVVLKDMLKDDLKDILRSLNLKVSGKKDVLIDRILTGPEHPDRTHAMTPSPKAPAEQEKFKSVRDSRLFDDDRILHSDGISAFFNVPAGTKNVGFVFDKASGNILGYLLAEHTAIHPLDDEAINFITSRGFDYVPSTDVERKVAEPPAADDDELPTADDDDELLNELSDDDALPTADDDDELLDELLSDDEELEALMAAGAAAGDAIGEES